MDQAREFTAAERKITLVGVMIVFLLSALDQTIVSTAMPVIVSQLHGLELYSWVTTSYLLASTVMVPIWGKLGDLHGRKPILLWGIGLFLAGSWLSGLSGEFGDLPLLGGGMVQLIVFRAIQGLGGGALFTTAFALIADLFPPRERGKFAGLFGAVFGFSSAVGPLLGGYFTDHGTVTLFGHVVAGWRWVFYLNLPVGAVALFMVIAKMPKLSHAAKGRIDFIGAALIVAACVPLLLALTLGGQTYPWGSPQVLGLFAMFVVCTALFIVVEQRVADPIIHLELFSNRVFTFANIAAFFSSMSFLSVVAFLPLFMQLGQGINATTSGLAMMPLTVALVFGAGMSGRLVAKHGKYKPYLLGGVALVFVGALLIGTMTPDTGRLDIAWRMAVLGLDLGRAADHGIAAVGGLPGASPRRAASGPLDSGGARPQRRPQPPAPHPGGAGHHARSAAHHRERLPEPAAAPRPDRLAARPGGDRRLCRPGRRGLRMPHRHAPSPPVARPGSAGQERGLRSTGRPSREALRVDTQGPAP